jgi:glucose 1-dehydrogenase
LAQAGAAVAIAYHGSRQDAEAAVAALRQEGGNVAAVELRDVSDPSAVAEVFRWMDDAFGSIDILVNNAGIDGKRQACARSDPAEWRRVIDVDLTGAYYCAREAAARMLKRGSGVIVNTTSVHEFVPWSGYSHYTAAKAGLGMLTKTLAQEVAEEGIRVVAVAPGAIKTPINENVWDDPKGRADLKAKIAAGRMGEPHEIGNVIAFLCSDLASYITGTSVVVDGGLLLYPAFHEGG